MKKTIWIITIDEVCDYEEFGQRPQAFEKEEDARAMLERFKKDIKSDYADELNDGWAYDEGRNFVEVYNDGWYSQDHYSVHLYEIELQ